MEPKSHYSFGIYKYGQGYWVRMLTAIMLGVLFLSAAAWAWGQLTKLSIPMPTWAFTVNQIDGSPAVGQSVTLLRAGNTAEKVGTAVIQSAEPSGSDYRLVVGDIVLEPNSHMLDAKQMEALGAQGARSFYGAVNAAAGIRVFDLVYIQIAVAGLIVLVGAWMIYYYVGRKAESVDFLIATDAEMRKVNWGTRKVILDSTWVVIGATFLIAFVIFLSDTILFKLAQVIGLMGTK
ncbi:MAG TPA: preprotein translocase subunit SecE [Phycisphaerales bacterium]|nr:preprotein translocase subunit SecE [Phycisphaerales bacterium]